MKALHKLRYFCFDVCSGLFYLSQRERESLWGDERCFSIPPFSVPHLHLSFISCFTPRLLSHTIFMPFTIVADISFVRYCVNGKLLVIVSKTLVTADNADRVISLKILIDIQNWNGIPLTRTRPCINDANVLSKKKKRQVAVVAVVSHWLFKRCLLQRLKFITNAKKIGNGSAWYTEQLCSKKSCRSLRGQRCKRLYFWSLYASFFFHAFGKLFILGCLPTVRFLSPDTLSSVLTRSFILCASDVMWGKGSDM